jgi:hypothetical protein
VCSFSRVKWLQFGIGFDGFLWIIFKTVDLDLISDFEESGTRLVQYTSSTREGGLVY